MQNVRQHRDKLASTGSTVFARSCQALPDLVIISKGIAPFCHAFIKCEVISKVIGISQSNWCGYVDISQLKVTLFLKYAKIR